jgi:hypothetical protein
LRCTKPVSLLISSTEKSLFVLRAIQHLEQLFSVVKAIRCTIFEVYWISLYMFRTVLLSIIRSLRLCIQHQVYVIQVLWLLANGIRMEHEFHPDRDPTFMWNCHCWKTPV